MARLEYLDFGMKDIVGQTHSCPGPCVAFSYFQNTHRHFNGFHIDLSYNEQPTIEFEFQRKLFNLLSEEGSELTKPDERWFKISQIFNKDDREVVYPQLFVSIGVSPKYFERAYQGSVEAMYAVDSLGNDVLSLGLKHDKKPWWINSNYNFNGWLSIEPSQSQVRIRNPDLEKYLESLQVQVA